MGLKLCLFAAYEFLSQPAAKLFLVLAAGWAFFVLLVPRLPALQLLDTLAFIATMTTLVVIGSEYFRGRMETSYLELFLSKPFSRWQLLVGLFLGGLCGASVLVALMGMLWSAALYLRLGTLVPSVFATCVAISLGFASILALIVGGSVILRQTNIPLVGALIYVLFGAGMLEAYNSGLFKGTLSAGEHRFLDALYYSLPQLFAIRKVLSGWMTGEDPSVFSLVHAVAISAIAIVVASFAFKRTDL